MLRKRMVGAAGEPLPRSFNALGKGAGDTAAFDPIELFRALPAPLPASPVSL